MFRKKISALVAVAAFMAAVAVPSAAQAALSPSLSQVINAGTLSVDFVDGSNASIASPSVSFGAVNFDFACQDGTATLATATQKLQIKNPVSGGVKVDINAQTPATDEWTDGGNAYKYNDATGSGCTNGQLTVGSDGTFTKTAGAGTPTVTTPGGAFTGTTPVTLVNNTGTVPYNADVTGFTLTQKIPGEQAAGTYSLPMVVTYVAQ
jgi:hypothetical protein